MAEDEDDTIEFCTLGMFIIDDIHFPPPKPSVMDILGGAGTYSALGARLFSPEPMSRKVGWVVDAGSDFPNQIRETIKRWNTSCVIRETPERLTTRGWNEYGEGEKRAFKYLTPKLRLDHHALTSSHLAAKSFHLICSPKRCIDLIKGILASRRALDSTQQRSHHRPLFLWEPVPDLCLPSEIDNCREALTYVDVVSPNHSELGGFFDATMTYPQTEEVDRKSVEKYANRWLDGGVGVEGQGAVVVRSGKSGSFLTTRETSRWFPAYHGPLMLEADGAKVVDPTGGGNAFLGGFAIGLVRGSQGKPSDKLENAMIYGSVAASFAIEQIGMPELGHDESGERWNGVDVSDRVKEYRVALAEYVEQ
ncbi:MAG: hypothetical protein M1833_007386 [Piccolia ochrophora]|nr:MAG: hypothetical protein M1833_007386 [Piccolia ochrophora]